MSTIERPAPARMTARFVVRAVVRITVHHDQTPVQTLFTSDGKHMNGDTPLPPALSSDHFFSGGTSSARGGVRPSWNGPAESSLRDDRCRPSSAPERRDAAVGLLPDADP